MWFLPCRGDDDYRSLLDSNINCQFIYKWRCLHLIFCHFSRFRDTHNLRRRNTWIQDRVFGFRWTSQCIEIQIHKQDYPLHASCDSKSFLNNASSSKSYSSLAYHLHKVPEIHQRMWGYLCRSSCCFWIDPCNGSHCHTWFDLCLERRYDFKFHRKCNCLWIFLQGSCSKLGGIIFLLLHYHPLVWLDFRYTWVNSLINA